MNKLHKTTLALTLFLSTHALLWAADVQKGYDLKGDSICFSMQKTCDFSNLDKFYGNEERRGVSFDGGGMRGLMEALWAVSIEEAANKKYAGLETDNAKIAFLERTGIHKRRDDLKQNEVVENGDIRFQDFFDFAAGTSTGSICAAALFHKNRFRATELLNLYVNLSVEIFDLQRQPSGTNGYFTSQFRSVGLKKLLSAYFGDSKMGDAFGNKKLYFGLTNEVVRSLELVTNQEVDYVLHPGCIKHYTDFTLVDIISTSCAAPTFFDANILYCSGNERFQLCDGGLSANNPGHVAFASEKTMNRYATEMYSFGTGDCHVYSVREKSSAVLEGEKYISIGISANTKGSIDNLKNEVGTNVSSLRKLFRINAELLESEQKLEDTSPAYLKLLLEKAYKCTETEAFKNMLANLGLDSIEHLPSLKNIINRVNSLDQPFLVKVVENQDFIEHSKEDFLLRSCLRRVCALDEEWFAPTSKVNIMDQKGDLSSKNSDNLLEQLQKYAKKSQNNKANKVLKTYFSAKKALEEISPLNQNQFDAALSERAIQNAKEELQKKASNSQKPATALLNFATNKISGVANFAGIRISTKTLEPTATTPQSPAAEEDPIPENEDANTALRQENSSANFNRGNQKQTAIENDSLSGWTDGKLSNADKSMWEIMNNYLEYLNNIGIISTNCSDVLSIASTLYVNILFQDISQDKLALFNTELGKLTTYLEVQKPLSSLTSLCRPIAKTLTGVFVTGGTRLTSLLEAVQKRIDNKPCLENSVSEIPETDDAAARSGE